MRFSAVGIVNFCDFGRSCDLICLSEPICLLCFCWWWEGARTEESVKVSVPRVHLSCLLWMFLSSNTPYSNDQDGHQRRKWQEDLRMTFVKVNSATDGGFPHERKWFISGPPPSLKTYELSNSPRLVGYRQHSCVIFLRIINVTAHTQSKQITVLHLVNKGQQSQSSSFCRESAMLVWDHIKVNAWKLILTPPQCPSCQISITTRTALVLLS